MAAGQTGVRIEAMRHLLASFPVTIAFGRPSRAELLILAGTLLVLGSGAGWLVWTARAAAPSLARSTPTVALAIDSTPTGTAILVDDQPHGATPAVVDVLPGPHIVRLTAADAIAETRQVDVPDDGAHLDLVLWRARPAVHYLKPTLPGAALADARFLDDGRVGLVIELPGGEHQAWLLDPSARFAMQRLGDIAPRTPLAIRPDGQQLAYLLPRDSTNGAFVAGLVDQPSAAVGLCLFRMVALGNRCGRCPMAPRTWST